MAKYDRNGVRHDGWAAVGEANKNYRGHGGSSNRSYEEKAREQGIQLDKTLYRKTSGYRYERT